MRITDLVLQSGEELPLSAFTVIIGGNGVGKSTLLRAVFYRATGRNYPRYRWLASTKFAEDTPKEAARLLLGSMAMQLEDGAPERRRYRSRADKGYEGSIATDVLIEWDSYEQLARLAASGDDSSILVSNSTLRRPFFASHSCDHRLAVPPRVSINPTSQPPQDALNVLWRHPSLRQEVSKALQERFQVQLALLDHRGSELELGIADQAPPNTPSGDFDRQTHFVDIETWKVDHWVPITEAGHGIRAMTNLLLSVFEPVNQVLVIDEPELHLYPSQKRALGAALVALAKQGGKQVVLATHDASFLQGVLDSTSDATILRVCFASSRLKRLIRPCLLASADAISVSAKQREYLNALFHEHVLLVEGASDRAFYQGIADFGRLTVPRDVGFVVGGGKGAMVNTGGLCARVGVPYAMILDFDAILGDQLQVIEKVLNHKAATLPADFNELQAQATQETIGHLGSGTTVRQAHSELKKTGLRTPGLRPETVTALNACMDTLDAQGVFLVRDGELESWIPEVTAKARFAEEALLAIETDPRRGVRVKDFLSRIYRSLSPSEDTAA